MFFLTPLGSAAVICPMVLAAPLLPTEAPEPSRQARSRTHGRRGRAGAKGGLTLRKAQRVYRFLSAIWPVLQPLVLRALMGDRQVSRS